jgi:hypothetical protein
MRKSFAANASVHAATAPVPKVFSWPHHGVFVEINTKSSLHTLHRCDANVLVVGFMLSTEPSVSYAPNIRKINTRRFY